VTIVLWVLDYPEFLRFANGRTGGNGNAQNKSRVEQRA
jgi:hypothetical protein